MSVLIPDARRVLLKAWSPRLIALAAVLEAILTYGDVSFLPDWAMLALLVAAFGARFAAQEGLAK